MRRVLPVLAMILLFVLGILFGASRGGMAPPPAPSPPVVDAAPTPPAPAKEPVSRLVVRRPAPAAPTTPPEPEAPVARAEAAGEPLGADTADATWREEAVGILDLPEEERARLGDEVRSRLDALEDACDDLFPPGETPVMLAMTLDDRGLLRLEVSSWSGEAAVVDRTRPLPVGLQGCLDDAVWADDWPTHEEPVALAITVPFTRD